MMFSWGEGVPGFHHNVGLMNHGISEINESSKERKTDKVCNVRICNGERLPGGVDVREKFCFPLMLSQLCDDSLVASE